MADNIQLQLPEAGAPAVRTTEDTSGKHHQHILMEFIKSGALQLVTSAEGLPVTPTGEVDSGNSRAAATLAETESFTGTWKDVTTYSESAVLLWASNTVEGTLYLEFSMDGSTVHRSALVGVADVATGPPHTVTPVAQYFRIRYVPTNVGGGANDHLNFTASVLHHSAKSKHLTSRVNSPLSTSTDVENVRAVLTGKDDSDQFTNVAVSQEGAVLIQGGNAVQAASNPFAVYQPLSTSAFGDQVSVNAETQFQLSFPYGIAASAASTETYTAGSATVSGVNSKAVLQSGTSTGSTAAIMSRKAIRYQPGLGATCRFTFGCTTSIDTTGVVQSAGLGDEEDGFFFSHRDNVMNIVRRYGGLRDVHLLALSSGGTSAGDVTINLAGVEIEVPVTNVGAGNANATVIELRDGVNWETVAGYKAYADGNVLVLVAVGTGVKSGLFSYTEGTTGATGTISQTVVGQDFTEEIIPQTSWNLDKADGTEILPDIDWSRGNVFQIRYQWLGYGAITFYLEAPATGNLLPVHRIGYANANVDPSVFVPTFRFNAFVTNQATTKDVTAFVGSAAGFVDGGKTLEGQRLAQNYEKVGVSTSFEPLVTLCAPRFYESRTARVTSTIFRLVFSASGAADFEILRLAELSGSTSWSSAGGYLLQDTSSTGATGGTRIWADRVEANGRAEATANGTLEYLVDLVPGEIITVVAKADSGSIKTGVAVNWAESL
tara:strand:+ start:24024 stop:26174 length:2151 start_codon:yes stop_codon:yes gene_type:complete